ncbi:MAG: iron-sulfur cluster assembly scaffold protein [Chloroflexi bacterium]|nr:iron-sulfur cluster assembly scaffold protein [Chloroflexota bacterium]
MYGLAAADHLAHPRNLGKLSDADGVGHVDCPETDTQVTIYVRLGHTDDGVPLLRAARFRAFGCGGCIIAASIATDMATGQPFEQVRALTARAILAALDGGLPAEQRYCADLVVEALRLALESAAPAAT